MNLFQIILKVYPFVTVRLKYLICVKQHSFNSSMNSILFMRSLSTNIIKGKLHGNQVSVEICFKLIMIRLVNVKNNFQFYIILYNLTTRKTAKLFLKIFATRPKTIRSSLICYSLNELQAATIIFPAGIC